MKKSEDKDKYKEKRKMENVENKEEQVGWKFLRYPVARVKANLMSLSAFRFRNKTHFSDMKCGPLSVNGVLNCLPAANICQK